MRPFPMVKKGNAPTLLDAALANRVLAFLNGISNARVTPAGAGKFVVTENGLVLDLSAIGAATQAQAIADLQKGLAQIQGQFNAIAAALKGATITAACDPSTAQIAITITFPRVP